MARGGKRDGAGRKPGAALQAIIMAWDHEGSRYASRKANWGDRSRHERGYGSKWVRTTDIILKRDKYRCQRCLESGRSTPLRVRPYDHAVDHIIPKARGGSDEHSNLQSLCAPCHEVKTAEDKTPRTDRLARPDGWNP